MVRAVPEPERHARCQGNWRQGYDAVVSFLHHPPPDAIGAERLHAATVAWAPLLGSLHAVGFRPYLELYRGEHDDPLRLYCELEPDLLLDLSIEDDQLPDTPPEEIDGDWAVFIQDGDGNYLADVVIDPRIELRRARAEAPRTRRSGDQRRAPDVHRLVNPETLAGDPSTRPSLV